MDVERIAEIRDNPILENIVKHERCQRSTKKKKKVQVADYKHIGVRVSIPKSTSARNRLIPLHVVN